MERAIIMQYTLNYTFWTWLTDVSVKALNCDVLDMGLNKICALTENLGQCLQ